STFYQPPDAPAIDGPRRLIMLLICGLLVALLAWAMAVRRRIVWRWHLLDIPVLLFAVGGIVSSSFSDQPGQSFLNPIWANDSILLNVICVLLYFGVKEFLRTREEILRGAAALVVAGAMMTALGYVDHIGNLLVHRGALSSFPILLNGSFSAEKLVGTMANPMITGSYISMLIPLALGLSFALTGTLRKVMLGVTIFLLPALILTQARSAWLALFLMLIIMPIIFFCHLPHAKISAKNLKILLIIVFVALALNIAIIARIPSIRDRVLSVTKLVSKENETVKTRIIYMTGAWNMFVARPVTGWGPGRFRLILPQYRPAGRGAMESGMPIDRGYCTSLPHNLPLQTAAEMGLVGLLPALLIVIIMAIVAWREMRYRPQRGRLAWALFGLIVAYILNNLATFDNAATMSLFWVGLGLLAALSARERTFISLTRQSSGVLQAGAVIFALGTCYFIIMNFNGSILTCRGLQRVPDEVSINPQNARAAVQSCHEGLGYIQQADEWMMGIGDLPIQEAKLINLRIKYIAAVRLDMKDPGNKAIIDKTTEDYVKANEDVLAIEPRDRYALRYYAIHLFGGKDVEKCGRVTAALRKYEPFSAEAHVLYARYLKMADKDLESIAELKLAQSIEPTYSDIDLLLGRFNYELYAGAGKNADAARQDGIAAFISAFKMGAIPSDEDINDFGTMWTDGSDYTQLTRGLAEITKGMFSVNDSRKFIFLGHLNYLLYRLNKDNAAAKLQEGKLYYATAFLQGAYLNAGFMNEFDELWAKSNAAELPRLIDENKNASPAFAFNLTGHVNYIVFKRGGADAEAARLAGLKAYVDSLEQNAAIRPSFLKEFDEMWLQGDYLNDLKRLTESEDKTRSYAGSVLQGHMNYLIYKKGGADADFARQQGASAFQSIVASNLPIPPVFQPEYEELKPTTGNSIIGAPKTPF
ncbi:MAG: O-antigen ligase family protein, partial [bacterium]